jgi:endonuclease YncB( thermonuclease family)
MLLSFLFACHQRSSSGPAAPATAQENCLLLSWEDGDTCDVDCSGRRQKIRLLGIDTAESGFDENSNARAERQVGWWKLTREEVLACGQAAARRVRELCPPRSEVVLRGSGLDKYGRRLSEVVCRGMNVNQKLVEEGLAGRYPYPDPPEKPAACGK